MPKSYQTSDEDMDASMYGGRPSEGAPKEGAEETPAASKQSVDEENAETQTAVVSNKILSPDGEPLKEGDEIVVRIVKNYGDESEIEYAPKGSSGDQTESTDQTAEEIAALDTEKA